MVPGLASSHRRQMTVSDEQHQGVRKRVGIVRATEYSPVFAVSETESASKTRAKQRTTRTPGPENPSIEFSLTMPAYPLPGGAFALTKPPKRSWPGMQGEPEPYRPTLRRWPWPIPRHGLPTNERGRLGALRG